MATVIGVNASESLNNLNGAADLNRNVVYPSLYLGQSDLSNQTTVEIKELKSDEDSEERADNCSYSHVWYNDEEQENSYKINKQARDRRRAQTDNSEIYSELFDQMCTEFYGIDCHTYDGMTSNQNSKAFTIINNNVSYTSSDEEFDAEVKHGDFLNGDGFNEDVCGENVIAHNNGFTEKRTIWIFSEKNRRALSENDYELINISGNDSSSTITDDEEPTRDISVGKIRRLATPIPSYIPKLLLPLSPTLPTVTEVVETCPKSSSNVSEVFQKIGTPQMPINNWVQEQKTDENETEECQANSIPKNLTPREKRRLRNEIINKTFTINKVQALIVENSSDLRNIDAVEKEIKISQLNDMNSDSATNDIEICSSEDVPRNLQKPQIKFNHQRKAHSEIITEPLEKMDGKWIGVETETTLDVYEYDLKQKDDLNPSDIEPSNKSVGNKFSVTNMALMKPAAWTQYLPITGSVPSLHLSFETDYEAENKSCLKKFFKFINCCKKVQK